MLKSLLPSTARNKIGMLFHTSKREIIKILDKYGIISVDGIYSEDYYAKMARPAKRHDAESVINTLVGMYSPSSVIDFGCGVGLYLSFFQQKGITVQGVEGATKALNYSKIDKNLIEIHDLQKPYEPTEFYDLALCIEVAEHLPEEAADTLVDSLCKSTNTIFFTAATPGQGGTHHINEQPRQYWIEKFRDNNYKLDKKDMELIRKQVNIKETNWVLENMFVFKNCE